MIQVRTVVCYVDFSGLSADVLAAGVRLARGFGARVLAAAVVPLPGVRGAGYLLPDTASAVFEVDYAQAAQQLEEMVRSTAHQGVVVDACPISGNPAQALVSLLARERAEILVLANSGSRPLLMRMNYLQEKLYRYAPCVVLNMNSAALAREPARPSAPVAPRRILVATRLEPPSEGAVLAGILLARHYSAELSILQVGEKHADTASEKFQFWQFLANFSSEAQTLLSSSVCPEWLHPQPKMIVQEGARDAGIIETASHVAADLLVIGARRPPLGTPLWPSLASRLAAGAPCPLLVVGEQALMGVVRGLRQRPRVVAAAS